MLLAQALEKCFTKAKISAIPFTNHAKHFATFSSSSSSPLLMLPARETAAAKASSPTNPKNIYTMRNFCFYNVQTQSFLTKEEAKNAALVDERQDRTPERGLFQGSTNGWLVFLDWPGGLYRPYISNALGSESFELPLVDKLPEGIVSRQIRILDNGSYEVSGFVKEKGGKSYVEYCKNLQEFATGVVITSPDGKVMALNFNSTELFYHRLGDDKWTVLEKRSRDSRFRDILFGQDDQKFYSTANQGPGGGDIEVQSWDFHDPSNPKKESYLVTVGGISHTPYETKLREITVKRDYFAQLSGEIHMITRHIAWHVTEDGRILRCETDKSCKYPYMTVACDVLKLDPVKKMSVQVKSLGDKALFLGSNSPFVLSASEFPGLKPDSIYFTDNQLGLEHPHPDFDEKDYPFGGHDCGIFSLKDGTFNQCYQTNSKQIFPPPVWIAPH